MGIISRYTDDLCDWAVWRIDEELIELVQEARDLKYFLSTIDQFGSEMRQKQWLSVRLLTNRLSKHSAIQYTDSGKPTIHGRYISISHSNELVSVMVSKNKEVGVDIQIKNDKILRISPKFLSETEKLLVKEDIDRITAVWCIKEALYKLYGDNSPHFKDDYEVVSLHNQHAIAKMRYKGEMREYSIGLRFENNFVIAFVTD